MSQDDETTAKELISVLEGTGISVSMSTVLERVVARLAGYPAEPPIVNLSAHKP